MGSMLRSSATAAYLVLAALFFSAAAFANLNDPDPLWWVVAYVGGGVALPAAHALVYVLRCLFLPFRPRLPIMAFTKRSMPYE